MWDRLVRRLQAVIGDDGTGALWRRLTEDGQDVLRLAGIEAGDLGQPCMADEHVLLAILRHDASDAAALLRGQGLDADTVRADLLQVGPSLGPRPDPTAALRILGIDLDQVHQRLQATFGPAALAVAERRARRRPRWRGGYARPKPLCVYLLARRSFHIAVRFANRRGDAQIGPEHLLYGILNDARDPLGAELGRRTRRQLATLGWTPGRPNPLRLILEARGIDVAALAAAIGA
jgi:ATP-dependent Clp protease ATP-binding subunit ClpA